MRSGPEQMDGVVDLDRYRIALDGGGPDERRALVDCCRAGLRADGVCQLEALMLPDAVQRVLEEARELAPKAFRTDATHNAYFTDHTAEVPDGDPRATLVRSAKRSLAWKYLPESSPLRALYEWDDLVAFLRDVLEMPALYRDADPLGACSVMYYDEGDELGWHFDNSEFAVTLMLQDGEGGGAYEYAPRVRSAENERRDVVSAVLGGDRTEVRSLHPSPGTLTLFQGRYSLHRVTPVEGATPRINAVLSYAAVPGHQLTERTRELFYGADDA